ncbi:MAG: c-type cytochrome [Casimicrobiaceae bacterium]
MSLPRGRRLCAVLVVAFSLAGAAAVLAQEPARIADTLEQRLLACAACHGKEGEGVRRNGYYPRIAGKPADYLYQQLENFRDGKRAFPQMVYFVRHLSDAYLREIADHYADLHPAALSPAAAAAAATMLRGATLVRKGDSARGIPACVDCHGDTLGGRLPAIPALAGLYPDYVTAQLESWQRGIRHARAPDCMSTIASKLGGADIAAITAWLAAQPVAAAPPQPPGTARLPLDCGSQHARAPALPVTINSRGGYLARIGDCEGCHSARGGMRLAGGLAMPTPFGIFHTPNITPDAETGIGRYTADAFYTALHDGRAADGSLLYPAFPYPSYTRITRTDADDLYRYLMSVPPVHAPDLPHELSFPYSQRALLRAWRALYFDAAEFVPQPAQSAQWNRGAYLVQGLGHCAACHSARNALGASVGERQLGGGMIASADWYAPSLSAQGNGGLGRFDENDLVALLRDGVSRRGAVFGPMALVVHDSLQYLTEEDARAMAIYLKSIAPSEPAAPPPRESQTEAQVTALMTAGARLYDLHCKPCHAADGSGNPSAYPPLAGNSSITSVSPVNPIRMVLFGGFPPSTRGNPRPFGMPPFAYTLDDREIAALVTYIRGSWGNRATAVAPTAVAGYRSVPAD